MNSQVAAHQGDAIVHENPAPEATGEPLRDDGSDGFQYHALLAVLDDVKANEP